MFADVYRKATLCIFNLEQVEERAAKGADVLICAICDVL